MPRLALSPSRIRPPDRERHHEPRTDQHRHDRPERRLGQHDGHDRPNGKPCKVVHSDDAKNTGTLSSSVTAGPGGVHSSTTGGPSVTVNSGNGSDEQHVQLRREFHLRQRHHHDDHQRRRLRRHRAQGQEVRLTCMNRIIVLCRRTLLLALAAVAGASRGGSATGGTGGIGRGRRHLRLDARHRRHLDRRERHTGSSLATGGSAAGGKTMDRSHVNETGNGGLNGQSKAMAHDGGTFSKSHTKTKVKDGESVDSRTKTMSHEPGSKPVKSTTSTGSSTGQ